MSPLPNQTPEDTVPNHRENTLVEITKTIVISVVLAFGIRTFVAEARYIPSGSMLPTLQIDDRLIIDKISYHFQDPQRGDIIVFMPPDAASGCTPEPKTLPLKDAYIKRVIGLPGDKVEVKNRQVYINDQPIKEGYINSEPEYFYPDKNKQQTNIVPANSYFVLGDNRNSSCDSHYWGFVPRQNIIGRAIFRFWPINNRFGNVDSAGAVRSNP